jgi:NADH-quinone oxidoreductase subunit H
MGISKRNTFLFTENIDKEGRGMGRAVSRLSSYTILFFLIVILITLYLGGWQNIYFIRGEVIFALKFYVIFIVLLLIDRATPGLDSYEYLIGINWRFLIPVSIINLILTMAFLVFRNIYNFV